MPKAIMCPYYAEPDFKHKISCEDRFVLKFLDQKHKRRYINEFCGSIRGWKRCKYAQALNKKYESEEAQ